MYICIYACVCMCICVRVYVYVYVYRSESSFLPCESLFHVFYEEMLNVIWRDGRVVV